MERLTYAGWPDCVRLSNGNVELIATTAVGPRILRFGFVGDVNEFWEDPATRGQTGGDAWRSYGGHRLWHAPEVAPRTYMPDNVPLACEERDGWLRLLPAVEAPTGIRKVIEIRLSPSGTRVELNHILINEGLWSVTLAPWSITVLAAGGVLVVPQEPFGPHPEHLLPARSIALWAYTSMADPRWSWGEEVVLLRQDPTATAPLKAGFGNRQGWLAYANHGHLFVKRFAHQPEATYPDLGSNCEAFTNAAMLEAETLGPLTLLAPGASVTHRETWELFADVPPVHTPADALREAVPRAVGA